MVAKGLQKYPEGLLDMSNYIFSLKSGEALVKEYDGDIKDGDKLLCSHYACRDVILPKEPYLVIKFTAEARKSMPFLKISPTNSNSVTMIFCMASCDARTVHNALDTDGPNEKRSAVELDGYDRLDNKAQRTVTARFEEMALLPIPEDAEYSPYSPHPRFADKKNAASKSKAPDGDITIRFPAQVGAAANLIKRTITGDEEEEVDKKGKGKVDKKNSKKQSNVVESSEEEEVEDEDMSENSSGNQKKKRKLSDAKGTKGKGVAEKGATTSGSRSSSAPVATSSKSALLSKK